MEQRTPGKSNLEVSSLDGMGISLHDVMEGPTVMGERYPPEFKKMSGR